MDRCLWTVVFFLCAFGASAHPGIGIVRDSRGRIFYTDLVQVWMIEGGRRTVVVSGVHSHELHMDAQDRLYGEQLHWDSRNNRFTHALWRRWPDGRIDTVVNTRVAYNGHDYALSRGPAGEEYFFRGADSGRIWVKAPDGRTSLFASGSFSGISWLHPQRDGSLLYTRDNAVYRIARNGRQRLLARNIARPGTHPWFRGSRVVYSVWQDGEGAVYTAIFSEGTVRRIDPSGRVTDYYRSRGNWAPVHGVFDPGGVLWLLESNDKNEVRVIRVIKRVASGK